jgi:hypothetical protein
MAEASEQLENHMDIVEQIYQPGVNCLPGYIAFTVRKKDFIAQGISWFERWDAMRKLPVPTHTFIVAYDGATIEAFANGVHEGKLDVYLNDPNVCLLVRRPVGYTVDLGSRIVQSAAKHVGHGYGYWLIAGMAVSNSFVGRGLDWLTRGWFHRTVEKCADSKTTEICSELVAIAAGDQPELANKGVLDWPTYTVKPVDLFCCDTIFDGGAIELLPVKV